MVCEERGPSGAWNLLEKEGGRRRRDGWMEGRTGRTDGERKKKNGYGRVGCYSALASSLSGSGSASGVFSTCMVTEMDQSRVRLDHLHQSELCFVSRSVLRNSTFIKLAFRSINHFQLHCPGSTL